MDRYTFQSIQNIEAERNINKKRVQTTHGGAKHPPNPPVGGACAILAIFFYDFSSLMYT